MESSHSSINALPSVAVVVGRRRSFDEQLESNLANLVSFGGRFDASGDLLNLPGHGHSEGMCGVRKYVTCVDEHLGIVDLDGNNISGRPSTYYINHCGSPTCPTDFEAWAKREGERAAHRLETFASLDEYRHIILSVPESQWSLSLEKLRARAIGYLRKLGLGDVATIDHDRRRVCLSCGRSVSDESKKEGICSCGSSKFVWTLGIHFHGLAHISSLDGELERKLKLACAKLYYKTGWVTKILFDRRITVSGTVQYQLTHAAINYSRKTEAIHYYGGLSKRKLKVVAEEAEKPKCPICGLELVPGKLLASELEDDVSWVAGEFRYLSSEQIAVKTSVSHRGSRW
jgi:hypothetical protein